MQKLHALYHGLKIRLMETSHNRVNGIVELCIPVLRQSFCEISTQNGAAAAGKAVRVISLCHLHADSFLLYPHDLPGALEVRAPYLHYHNELGLCTEGSGIFFLEDQIIPFQAPCVSVIYSGQIHIAQTNPDHPARWYFLHVDECILSAEGDELLTAGHMGAPILDQSTAEGRDIMALIQMMTSELQAGKPSMRGVAGQKHAVQACPPLRSPRGSPREMRTRMQN